MTYDPSKDALSVISFTDHRLHNLEDYGGDGTMMIRYMINLFGALIVQHKSKGEN